MSVAAKRFVRRNRRGKMMTVAREHYLRDDLPIIDPETHSRPASGRWLVLDTNVPLHQMDVLEHKAITHCIILQTVLEETKHQDLGLYKRLRACINNVEKSFVVFSNEHHRETFVERQPRESPNDRNDRAIRTAAAFYTTMMEPAGLKVLMVTNDVDNREHAAKAGLESLSIHKVVESYDGFPDLRKRQARPTHTPTHGRVAGWQSFAGGRSADRGN